MVDIIEMIILSKELKKESELAMWISGEEHSRQRTHYVARLWGRKYSWYFQVIPRKAVQTLNGKIVEMRSAR